MKKELTTIQISRNLRDRLKIIAIKKNKNMFFITEKTLSDYCYRNEKRLMKSNDVL